jgi:KaiC/GvpD/RAD55 family RecA-like ATPase
MNNPPIKIIRKLSGIEGFDEVLKGGIPNGDITLVTGTPGSGKTTFGMQVLAYGAKHNEIGIYFTLEESAKDIIEQYQIFDPDVIDLIADGKLKIVEVPLSDYETFKQIITSEIEAAGAKRVAIDSVTYFQMFFSDIMSVRKAIIEVSEILKVRQCLGLLIGEIAYGEDKLSTFGVEEFAVDGVVALYLIEKQQTFLRALRVVKMRNTAHLTKFCPIEITERGIVVYPNSELFTEL